MIKQISHPVTATGPADITLALGVAYELHTPAPVPAPRAPEVAARAPEVAAPAVPQLMGLRVPATRPHRHKVPLKRLTAVRG
ncbi:hypothetical protein ABZX30_02570 [Streptomyces sp. NPDC004542]|uniref:hypothetical protein n=1 Tax=Streptomyces sp. NPDC004542 TaxID=3154281 RepID=UPI0033B09376